MSTLEKEELYVDNYYDHPILLDRGNFRNENLIGKIDELGSGVIIRCVLTVLLRVGFLLIQIGSVPVGNVNLILLQNIVDFCTVTTVSILVGFIVSFTGDNAGVIGRGVWIGDSKANMNEAILGWSVAVTASAICTCGIVGRMHAIGYLITAILISGIVQPLLIHWAWTPQGWMADNSLKDKSVSFKDFAGGGTVHVVGGLSGFLGCVTLGRRILRLRDIDDASLPADSPGLAFAGYFLIFLGLQGLSLPVSDRGMSGSSSHNASRILINNLLASSSSSLFIVALHFALSREAFNYWTVMRCIQAAISGIISIAAGVDLYSPLIVLGISCSSGLVFYLVSRRVYRSALEDYCNITATHLACALFGSFLAPLCGRPKSSEAVHHAMVLDVAWQVICILALLGLVALAMVPFFLVLEICGFLRNRSEFVNHLRATTALERGPPRSYMQRLFFPGTESLYLQPGSVAKTGQGPQFMSPRLWRYQQELARIEQTRSKQIQDGNNLSDVTEERVISSEDPIINVPAQRIKKPRQIFTVSKNINSSKYFDVGGTGESLENKRELVEYELNKLDVVLPGVAVEGDKVVVEDAIKLDTGVRNVNRNSDEDYKYASSKHLSTMLHRTPKFASLHSEEPDTKLDYPKVQRLGVDVTQQSDFIVKVLLEPRKKLYGSSDSDNENEEVVKRIEDVNKIIKIKDST